METVKVDFKFEIGDIITSIIVQGMDRQYLVVERIYRECPGGGQKSYQVRNFSSMVTDTYLHVNEIEMRKWEEKK